MKSDIYHRVCERLARLIRGTEWDGRVYAVGGCCRDEVMGREINDIDLAVNLPDGGVRFAEWLHKKRRTRQEPTYFPRYGTAMLHLRDFPDLEIELVQTRKGSYTDETADSPGSVFGSVTDDAFRRDFTINSLFYNITTRELLDPTGKGIDDIHNRTIRTPLDPELTFLDDPVRILRGIRLACALGWQLDDMLIKAMGAGIGGLRQIKPERRHAELDKMLGGNDPVRAMIFLRKTGAMQMMVPELVESYTLPLDNNGDTLWKRSLRMLENVSRCNSLAVRFAALFFGLGLTHDRHDGSMPTNPQDLALRSARTAEEAMRRLKYHSKFIKSVTFLIRNQAATCGWGERAQRAKDRQLQNFKRLCTNDHRLADMLCFIDALNHTGPLRQHAFPDQISHVRERLKHIR